ncbi:MAG: hypothetical protein Q7R33_06680 [Nitrosarchaeum sp.]|nr:hypothetical protein [Nitrosarchaeum sp.]
MKKAQLSGFMIVLVLIALAVFLLVSFVFFTGFNHSDIDSEIQPFIQSCVDQSTMCGLVTYGLDGKKPLIDVTNRETLKCSSTFEQFKKQGYNFESGKPLTTITKTNSNVKFSVNYPIQVKKLEKSETYNQFENVISIPLQRLEEQKKQIERGFEINENLLMQRNSKTLVEEIDARTIQTTLIDNTSVEYWYVINQIIKHS